MRFLLPLTLIACVFSLHAQDCFDAYSKAKKSFEAGKIEESIEILEPCASYITNPDEQFEAYKLLAMAFQKNNEFEDMEYYIWKMLSLKPDYQNYPNSDPDEFTRAVKKFTVKQTWDLGVKAGTCLTSVLSYKSHSTLDYPQRYVSTAGFQLGVFGNYSWKEKLTIESQLQLSGLSFQHLINPDMNWNMTYTENYRMLDFNALAKYQTTIQSSFRPYAAVGPGLGLVLRSRGLFIYNDLNSNVRDEVSTNSLGQRHLLQMSMNLNAGLQFDLDRGSVDIELSYRAFLRNTVKDSKRYDDEAFIFTTAYVSDDLRLQQLGINLKYSIPLLYDVSK